MIKKKYLEGIKVAKQNNIKHIQNDNNHNNNMTSIY